MLGDLQTVVDLNPEVTDGAFDLGVPKHKLNCAGILDPSVDQRGSADPTAGESGWLRSPSA